MLAVPDAGTSTEIPWASSSSVYVLSVFVCALFTFTTILPASNVVSSGILSFTIVVAGAVPSLLKFIVYVIFSPFFTFDIVSSVLPSGSDVFVNTNFDLFTVSVTSSVSSPSTVAVFLNTFVNVSKSSPCNGSTVTSKLKLTVPAVSPTFAGTFTCIPLFKFVSV